METITKSALEALDALIAKSKTISILVHMHPDGDAVGSGAAVLDYVSVYRKKDAVLILPDPAPGSLDFLIEGRDVIIAADDPDSAEKRLAESDLVFFLDHNAPSRTGCMEKAAAAYSGSSVLVDHHLESGGDRYTLAFSTTETSSTCELAFRILSSMPEFGRRALPVSIGTPLLTGMTTDTNNFANSVFPSTFRMASALLDAGVDRDAVLQRLYNGFRANRFAAMGCFLSEKLRLTEGGAAYVVFDEATLRRYGLEEGETEGFVNLPLGIREVRLSIFLRQDDGYFRVSTRSKKGTSAASFAATYFHGGGHECAAGGRLYFPGDIESPEQAEKYVEEAAARFMQDEAPATI